MNAALSAWCPGGRTAAKARDTSPSSTDSTACKCECAWVHVRVHCVCARGFASGFASVCICCMWECSCLCNAAQYSTPAPLATGAAAAVKPTAAEKQTTTCGSGSRSVQGKGHVHDWWKQGAHMTIGNWQQHKQAIDSWYEQLVRQLSSHTTYPPVAAELAPAPESAPGPAVPAGHALSPAGC